MWLTVEKEIRNWFSGLSRTHGSGSGNTGRLGFDICGPVNFIGVK